MWSRERNRRRKLLFQPLVLKHFTVLLLLTFLLYILFFLSIQSIFIYGLDLHPMVTVSMIWLSLFGSSINIPVKEIVSDQPIVTLREFSFFGFRWILPNVIRRPKTIVAVNIGGAVIPILLSLYLLLYTIPSYDASPLSTYLKIFVVTAVVVAVVNKFSKLIPGVGVAVPSFIPPITTALATFFTYNIHVISNPYVIAYISGTLGTLIGADVLNLTKISRIGAAIVSVGGAGTFDGIYMTGLISMLLIFIFL